MTAASLSYPRASERLAARLGRALLSWADSHARRSRPARKHRVWTHDDERARAERERERVLRLYLHGGRGRG
jgi:hypothetical protein